MFSRFKNLWAWSKIAPTQSVLPEPTIVSSSTYTSPNTNPEQKIFIPYEPTSPISRIVEQDHE